MAVFQVIVQKDNGAGVFWVNDYLVNASTIDTAHEAAVAVLAPAEQAMHVSFMTVNKVRTSTLATGDRSFRSTDLALAGTLSASGNALPLFNVMRVELTGGEGNPGRKFFRCGLGSGNLDTEYRWTTAATDDIQGVMDDLLTAMTEAGAPIYLPGTRVVTLATAKRLISMRQLRRGSRRPLTPII